MAQGVHYQVWKFEKFKLNPERVYGWDISDKYEHLHVIYQDLYRQCFGNIG